MTTGPRTTPRKQPLQERSRATVDAILDATAKVLVARGLDGTSTNHVAVAAGVSVGSLYQYFPNKDALITALIERHLVVIHPEIARALQRVATAPITEAVREMVRLWIKVYADAPELHRVVMEQVPRRSWLPKAREFQLVLQAAVAALLRARGDEVLVRDVDTAAFLVVSVIGSVAERAVLFSPQLLGDPALVDELTAMLVGYLVRS